MMKVTGIFDCFASHKAVRRWSLAIFTIILAVLFSTLRFSENVSDFLPLGNREKEQFSIFQNVSGANRIFVLFSNPGDEHRTIEAIESFVGKAGSADSEGWLGDLSGQFDMGMIGEVTGFVYENAPYFLTDADYERMDSLLARKDYVASRLEEDRNLLMFPSSAFTGAAVSRDPLGLFSPVAGRLRASGDDFGFEILDGYVFTSDLSRAIVMLESPFGGSETSGNSKLVKLLESAAEQTEAEFTDIAIDITGGPAVAVGNSSRIKRDSILAICLSVFLIFIILAWSFRSARNILLIFLSAGWGLLFALGGLAILRGSVSVIVIGISSVILGIAVNYPLHLIAHNAHQPNIRTALKEIQSPLVIGNITTVGAFLALVPLRAAALRDLGLFASLLLAGTILFVLLYLPHYVSPHPVSGRESRLGRVLSSFSPEKNRYITGGVLIVTCILAAFSFGNSFDTDLTHINYMTPAQKRDMQYFEDLFARDIDHNSQTIYIYGKGESLEDALAESEALAPKIDSLEKAGKLALQNRAWDFIVSRKKQAERLAKWSDFTLRHRETLIEELDAEAGKAGFSSHAFDRFKALVNGAGTLRPKEPEYFAPLTESVFRQNFTVSDDGGQVFAVNAVNVETQNFETVKEAFGDRCFDVRSLNGSLASRLSDNFNYIGWACSLIVFFFLWFSFGRLELALISFIPMAVSWIWILGLMSLLGIRFNIVNVILATFIFGQGDDYTIFMTEGCQYEYARKKEILRSYKKSILESAAIMFVGIGTLIVARHPALRSLAEVTIVGMFSVVLMAYMIPPLLFKFLTEKAGMPRKYPLTLRSLLSGKPDSPEGMVRLRYAYRGRDVERSVRKSLKSEAAGLLEMKLPGEFEYEDKGYGELAMLLALANPSSKITVRMAGAEERQIAVAAAEGFVNNLEFK